MLLLVLLKYGTNPKQITSFLLLFSVVTHSSLASQSVIEPVICCGRMRRIEKFHLCWEITRHTLLDC